VRRLIDSLRPSALDELGLTVAIRESTTDLQRAGLRIEIDSPSELGPISAATETAAYRIVMEGVTNVLRHAHASECRVSLTMADRNWLRIEISDDGIGIPDIRNRGFGLGSMRERATELGGAFALTSEPVGGTIVTVTLPLDGQPA
jgi:signal transduction histidine kinase